MHLWVGSAEWNIIFVKPVDRSKLSSVEGDVDEAIAFEGVPKGDVGMTGSFPYGQCTGDHDGGIN